MNFEPHFWRGMATVAVVGFVVFLFTPTINQFVGWPETEQAHGKEYTTPWGGVVALSKRVWWLIACAVVTAIAFVLVTALGWLVGLVL